MSTNAQDESMRKLVLGIALALVDDPNAGSVEITGNQAHSTIRLTVAASDAGKVIGRQGRTARAIRTVLTEAGLTIGWPYELDIPLITQG
jgi:predicted RNA-binding protein YlqC (UPF0109 family)